VIIKTLRKFSQEAKDDLWGCLEATDWSALSVTDYTHSCVQTIIPTRTAKCFPNNKTRITGDMKKQLKMAFWEEDGESLRGEQKQLK